MGKYIDEISLKKKRQKFLKWRWRMENISTPYSVDKCNGCTYLLPKNHFCERYLCGTEKAVYLCPFCIVNENEKWRTKTIKYIDKGTARQHLTDRLMESALNNVGIKADADEVFRDIAETRLPIWLDELQTYDVQEVRHGRWKPYLNEGLIVKCSICGSRYAEPWHYCPNCGSRMDLEGEEE